MSCNPLLTVLNESRANEDDPETGLLKMMMALQMSKSLTCVFLALDWHERHGNPTWDSLRQFAREYATHPDNARHMEVLAKHSVEVLSSLSVEKRKAVEPFLE
jgi:hypothetical protein